MLVPSDMVMIPIPYRGKVYTEYTEWPKLVKYMELNISHFLIIEFGLYKLSLKDLKKFTN